MDELFEVWRTGSVISWEESTETVPLKTSMHKVPHRDINRKENLSAQLSAFMQSEQDRQSKVASGSLGGHRRMNGVFTSKMANLIDESSEVRRISTNPFNTTVLPSVPTKRNARNKLFALQVLLQPTVIYLFHLRYCRLTSDSSERIVHKHKGGQV